MRLTRPPAGDRARRTPCASRSRAAFTLPEASLAVLIVAIGFVAVMELFGACTNENQRSAQITTAQMLVSNVQEMMGGLFFRDPYNPTNPFGPDLGESELTWNDFDDFDGASFNPPKDSMRATIPELAKYAQIVTVTPVDPNRPGNNTDETKLEIGKGVYTGALRVRVIVKYRARPTEAFVEVLNTSWIRLDN